MFGLFLLFVDGLVFRSNIFNLGCSSVFVCGNGLFWMDGGNLENLFFIWVYMASHLRRRFDGWCRFFRNVRTRSFHRDQFWWFIQRLLLPVAVSIYSKRKTTHSNHKSASFLVSMGEVVYSISTEKGIRQILRHFVTFRNGMLIAKAMDNFSHSPVDIFTCPHHKYTEMVKFWRLVIVFEKIGFLEGVVFVIIREYVPRNQLMLRFWIRSCMAQGLSFPKLVWKDPEDIEIRYLPRRKQKPAVKLDLLELGFTVLLPLCTRTVGLSSSTLFALLQHKKDIA